MLLNNKNIVHTIMEISAAPWCNWCLLCGKEDAENNVNIEHGDHQPLEEVDYVKLNLKETLEKYFSIQSCEDLLPKHLCFDCYSLMSSIMLFNERVERVQRMYKFLLENPMYDSCDLKSVRIKFDVSDGSTSRCQSSNGYRESTSDNDQETKEDSGIERFTVDIKQENCDTESSLSEYEGNNDVDSKSVDIEEVLYDEEFIDNESKEQDKDPFDALSDESSCDEDETKIDPKATIHKRTSASDKKRNANTVVTSNRKRRRREFGETACMKKKNMAEDFVLDVTCKECGQKLYLYSTYCEHLDKLHANASAEKCCPICNRSLQTWYHLGRHMRVHMPLEYRKPIKCADCDNRYTTTAQLEVHINHKHRNTKPFICEVCGFCGGTKHSLTQHMYMHTDNAPFECEVCKKKFKKRSRLNFHMDIHGPNKFVCAICGLQLNSRATLKNHYSVHSDKMQHKCEYCGKAFKRSKYLKNHLLLHTGLKPYSCNFCDLTYSNRTNCRGHMRKMHPDELALWDAAGNKAYTKNVPKLETLKAVTKAADNLKPVLELKCSGSFVCDFCDNRFTYRQSCRAHMKMKHPNEFGSLETHIKKKPEKKRIVDWFDYGKSEICDFCERSYVNRRYCRAHIMRKHFDELASISAPDKKHAKTTPSKATDNLESVVTKFRDGVTTALQSMVRSKSPVDLTPCTSNTCTTNIQDYFLLID